MLSTLHTAHAALLAAVVGGFALAAPSTARAQSITGEQALLNRVDPAPRARSVAFTQVRAAHAANESVSSHGERALLNQSRALDGQLTRPPQSAQPGLATTPYADGVKALLNRSNL